MAHFPLGPLRCAALVLAPVLLAGAGEPVAFQPRLAAVETVMERFYRGENLEAGHQRVNALVERFNAQVEQRNTQLEAARAEADRQLAPSKELAATLDAQDQALGPPPAASDPQAMRRYNEQVKARNALA